MMDAKENEQSKILWVDVLHIIKMWLTYSYNTYDWISSIGERTLNHNKESEDALSFITTQRYCISTDIKKRSRFCQYYITDMKMRDSFFQCVGYLFRLRLSQLCSALLTVGLRKLVFNDL